MNPTIRFSTVAPAFAALLLGTPALARAQLGAQLGAQRGLLEPNVASDSAMTSVPHITAGIAAALKAARPILGPMVLDSILAADKLTKAQRTEVFARLFVHVDLNRGSDHEFMLVPGMDAAKLNAVKAGRPWKDFATFRAELTKVSNATEATRLEQYVFIPIELNTFTNETMDTFASIGVGTRQWKREFAEYRPWTSMEQFDREIGKYLRSRPAELQRLKRYVYVAK